MVINLALGKPTSMSSVYFESASWKGVDGKREPRVWGQDPTKHTCAATMSDDAAWWQVDLQAVYVIREVVFTPQYSAGELQCFAALFSLYLCHDTYACCTFVCGSSSVRIPVLNTSYKTSTSPNVVS